jgi:hypothetical protein
MYGKYCVTPLTDILYLKIYVKSYISSNSTQYNIYNLKGVIKFPNNQSFFWNVYYHTIIIIIIIIIIIKIHQYKIALLSHSSDFHCFIMQLTS